MRIFKEACKIIEDNAVLFSDRNKDSVAWIIKGKSDNYLFRIYLKVATWFSQCGCRVGVSNKPNALCKHQIAGIVKTFLKVNNMELVKK